jgi:ParB family chromosome partitioning protein
MGLIEDVDVFRIKPSINVRCDIPSASLEELCNSIRHRGLLQPIIVRTLGKGDKQSLDATDYHDEDIYASEDYYEIVAGNRRYQACKSLGWRKIICHIVELDDKQAFEVSLIENIQRKTLSAIEEAHAFKRYVEDFGWGGISDLALRIGKSVSYVDKRLRLLNFPPEVIEKISNSIISSSIAEELIPVHNKEEQSALAEIITERKLSLRKTRDLIRSTQRVDESFYDLENQHEEGYDGNDMHNNRTMDIEKRVQHSFDKSIIVIKIAMNKLTNVMQNIEDDWIIYEIMREHKNMLHAQIDLLIREKRKLSV